MKCSICGGDLPENANFCPVCGTACQRQETAQECPAEPMPEAQPSEEPVSAPDFILMEEPDLQIEDTAPAEEPEENIPQPEQEPPVSTRKRRPGLVPVLIMAAMLVVGTVCFFLFPYGSEELPEATSPIVGDQEESALPLPPGKQEDQSGTENEGSATKDFIPTDEACFRMTAEGIEFLPGKYDGGKVLVIPAEVDGKPVTAIAPYGFSGCTGVSTVILPDTLETIGEYAFAGCEELRGIWFPDSMRRIGEGAFRDCIGLESVAVQSGMESIGQDAFTGCARLFYFFYDGSYEQWLKLYNEFVTPYTSVTCLDGDYYHGVEMP